MSSIGGRSGSFVVPGGLVELAQRSIPYSAITFPHTSGTDATSASFATPITLDFVSDGSPVLVEFWDRGQIAGGAGTSTSSESYVTLFLDGVFQQRLTRVQTFTASDVMQSVKGEARLTPSAGSHTIELKQFRVNADGAIDGGGSFLRVSKIVQQNDGLKPFWTPPIVTDLPSQATEGDRVVKYTTNGAYQPYFYTGATDGWKQLGTSKPPMCKLTRSTNQSISDNTVTVVAYDTAAIDTDSMATTGTSAKITANTEGVYAVGYTVLWGSASTTGYRQAWVTIDGSGRYAGSTVYPNNSGTGAWMITGSDILELSEGQSVDLRVVAAAGTTETITPFAGNPIAFYAYWIGATS